MTRKNHKREDEFETALNEALLHLRYILGKHQVCPVCYCKALSDVLDGLGDAYDHNEEVDAMSLEDLEKALKDPNNGMIQFMLMETEGSA